MELDIQPTGGAPVPETEVSETPSPNIPETVQDADPNFDPLANPLVKAVTNAEIPGVLVSKAEFKSPLVAPLVSNGRSMLTKTGLGFYQTKDGQVAMFNPQVLSKEEVQQLDAKGKLGKILVPLAAVLGGPAEAPAAGTLPGGYDAMTKPQASAGAVVNTPPAAPSASRTRARAAGSAALPVTRRASPLGGGLYNDMIQPAV